MLKYQLSGTAEDEEFGFNTKYEPSLTRCVGAQSPEEATGLYYNLPPLVEEPDLPPPPPPPASIPMHQYYDYQNINLKPTLPRTFKSKKFGDV